MKVSVGFSTQDNLLGRVTRWVTGSKVSHTWLLIEDLIPGVLMVMQAAHGGFQLITYEMFQRGSSIVVQVVAPKQDISGGVTQALQWLGEAYDTRGMLGMAWVELGRRFKRRWRNWLHTSNALWCSEANVLVLQAAGYPGAAALDPTTMSPQDLLTFMTT